MYHLLLIDILIALAFQYPGEGRGVPIVSQMQPGNCAECHSDLIGHEVMHYPAEDACDNCHESTGASHPREDSMGFRLMDKVPELCFYCHEEPVLVAHGHKPVYQGECLTCHDVHGSSEAALIQVPEQELCLSCHNKAYHTDTSETVNISKLVRGKMNPHSAIPNGGCMVCHQAHGSDFRANLVGQYPEEDYVAAETENFGLCFMCHDTDLIDAEETEWATNFRNGTRNLHQLHINGYKGRNCRMCHNLHGSTRKFLIEETVVFGNWEMRLNFIPEEQGGSCLPGCHGRLSYER